MSAYPPSSISSARNSEIRGETMPKSPARRPRSTGLQSPRLPALAVASLTPAQQKLVEEITTGPRGSFTMGGPFAVYLHAPVFGHLAQQLGAHVRYRTAVPPRLLEFAILCTAHQWRAQFEWAAHAPIAERQGVKPATIRDLKDGRKPKTAPPDEMAIYAFVKELYKTRRVSERTYKRVQKILGDAGTVELVGILGNYTLVSMVLNVFRMPVPEDTPPPFREPASS
jgi:4-carboxymuconolactone decarboxylase